MVICDRGGQKEGMIAYKSGEWEFEDEEVSRTLVATNLT